MPDSYRILNILLTRLEDLYSGKVIQELYADIPEYYFEEAKFIAGLVGNKMYDLNLLPGVTPLSQDNLEEMYLNNTWRPWLTVTGMDDFPATTNAGNVIRK